MKKLIKKFDIMSNNLTHKKVINNLPLIFFILLILVFLTRFYSIGMEVIDWDEADFILMGNSFYQGNLPYLELWDLKPPVHFFLIGFAFKLFGPSLLVARLLGAVLVLLSSILIVSLTKNILNNFEKFLAAALYILLVSFEFAQPTMTEFTAAFFILFSFYCLTKKTHQSYFWSGLLISLGVLTRTNIAFVVLALIIYFYKRKVPNKKITTFILGGLIPLTLLMLIYTIEGALKQFLYSVFVIPLGNTSIRENFFYFLSNSFRSIFMDGIFSLQVWFLGLILFLIINIYKKQKKLSNHFYKKIPEEIMYNIIILFSLILSIIAGGRFFYHYLIQLFPFISILLIFMIKNIFEYKSTIYIISLLILSINTFSIAQQSINNIINYSEIERNYEIKSFVKHIDNNQDLLALENHLIYFYTGIGPITPIVHPNTITKTAEYEVLLRQLVQLDYIVDNEFNIILQNKPMYIFCENECSLYISKKYLREYEIIKQSGDIKLYKKRI